MEDELNPGFIRWAVWLKHTKGSIVEGFGDKGRIMKHISSYVLFFTSQKVKLKNKHNVKSNS